MKHWSITSMSMNYAFGFSLFLLVLVALNIYFFYTLNTKSNKPSAFNIASIKLDLTSSVFKDIYEYLNYLPNQYKVKNQKFIPIQKNLLNSFGTRNTTDTKTIWQETESWSSEDSLFPHENGAPGQILQAIQSAQIALVDNAPPRGTQMKLLLVLEGNYKLYFKPKRYQLEHVVNGNIYAGFDRHNSEVFAFYLAMVLNYKWIPPSAIRRIHFDKDIIPTATLGLKKTMIKNVSGSLCIYGKCFYCNVNETICPDKNGEIEGAAILYLDKKFQIHKSPWRRSYTLKKMEWEIDNDFCKKVSGSLSTKRLLNLVDVAIFDFLIQNGDRHRYEVYKDRIVLLDNGKGLGNPLVDELDILAPLYQCCIKAANKRATVIGNNDHCRPWITVTNFDWKEPYSKIVTATGELQGATEDQFDQLESMVSSSTWQNLELLSGGSLSETIKLLSALQGSKLATEDHYKAIERRLMKIYATVQYCIGKYGSAKVFKNRNSY